MSPADAAGVSTSLIGRAAERSRLDTLLTGGSHGCLVVRGDPGVGKSALLQDACARADARGSRVVAVSGVEAESGIAYAGLHQLLRPFRSFAADLDPEQRNTLLVALGRRSAGNPPSVLALGTAALDLIGRASAQQHVLLAIDDGHWFDAPSIAICLFIARRLEGLPTSMVVTIRDGDESGFDTGGLAELSLRPLSPAEADQLLSDRHPQLSSARHRLVLDHARGNPLALDELPRCLASEGPDTAYLRASATLPLNRRLEQLYAQRIDSMSAEEREELLLGALDGLRPTRVGGAYRLRHVTAAQRSGLVDVDVQTGDASFRHPLVRSAVVQRATSNARRRAHQRLADHYVGDVERRAEHLAAAAVDPDESVAAELEAAAASAVRRGGAGAALFWLTRAAELSESAPERGRRLSEASFLAGQAGELAESSALLDDAAHSIGGADTPASVLSTGHLMLYLQGDVLGTHRRVAATITVHHERLDDATLDRLVQLLLVLSQFAADEDIWRTSDSVVDAHAARLSPMTLIYRDAWGDVVRRGRDLPARLAAAFADLAEGAPWDGMRLAVCAYYADALADYRSFLDRMIEQEQATGAITPMMTMVLLTMLDDLSAGEWDRAERTGERGLSLTEEHGHHLFSHQFRNALGVIAAQRGDTERAQGLRRTVESWARPRGIGHLIRNADIIGLQAALGAGDFERAWSCATRVTAPGTFAPGNPWAIRTFLDLVEAAVYSGRADQGRLHLEVAVALGLGEGFTRLSLCVAAARALLAEGPDADGLYAAALEHPAGRDLPFERARVTLAYGMWLRRHRRVSDARVVLADAAEVFERLGAHSWLARARDELATTGATRLRPEDRLEALTARERLVAELAATGLSNKQIGAQLSLSPKTVGAHLYRVFPKLGITSRAALRDVLAEVAHTAWSQTGSRPRADA